MKYSFKQAQRFHPDTPIILLGDQSNSHYDMVSHHLITDYSNGAQNFEKLYKHRSQNDYDYELFCFKRWFIIKEFIDKNGCCGSFICLDSDVLIYDNLNCISSWLQEGQRMTICNSNGPEYAFFDTSDVLATFCAFICKIYTDHDYSNLLDTFYSDHVAAGRDGGVCDMTAFYHFSKENPALVADLHVIKNRTVFVDNFIISDGFVMDYGKRRKKVYWKNGSPYGIHIESGEYIRFLAIHFQGKAKKIMPRYFRGQGIWLQRLKDLLRFIHIR